MLRGCKAVVLLSTFLSIDAFVWPIDGSYNSDSKFTYSELYMYADNNAPMGIVTSKAEIHVDIDIRLTESEAPLQRISDDNLTVAVAIFHVPAVDVSSDLDTEGVNEMLHQIAKEADLCRGKLPTHSSQLLYQTTLFKFQETHYDAHVNMHYEPRMSGVQSVIIEICKGEVGSQNMLTHFSGTMTFRNPYGYLSAIYFGYIPFEGFRAVAFGFFAVIYIFLLCVHRERLIPIHYGIIVVILIAFTEALAWFAAYLEMNDKGMPYCCPFPSSVVVSMVLEMLRRTLSRALLLVLSMGFGIVRTSMSIKEITAVTCLSLAYLIASVTVDARDIIEINDLHHTQAHSLWWDLPVLIFDLAFLIWIYLSLLNTMTVLRSTGQSYKLDMYTKLAYTMGMFVVFVSILTLVIVLAHQQVFSWPWQLYWMQTVAWEVLNLATIVAVSLIWAPSARSQMLAQSKQLATNDDDDMDNGAFTIEGAFEMEMVDVDEESGDAKTQSDNSSGYDMIGTDK